MRLPAPHALQAFRSLRDRVGRTELTVLAAILLPAGLLAAFIALASEVIEGEMLGFDKAVLLALRNPADPGDPLGPAWREMVMKDITSLGSVTVLTLVTLAAASYLLIARNRGATLLVIAAVGGGTLLSNLLKYAFARPRPDVVAHSVEVATTSFPSGHAMLSAVTYLTLGALLASFAAERRRKAFILGLAVLLTVAVGISRVYLGVHYPTDVLAGWAVGAAWAMLCVGVSWWLRRRRQM